MESSHESHEPELTPKAMQTRQRIVDTALRLFTEKGYEATTMRDIAAEAGCSLGLAYRYFTGKEELVVESYRCMAEQLDEIVASLPPEPLARRFEQAMRTLLDYMAPQRETFGALFGAALNPSSAASVFGPHAASIRRRTWRTYLTLIRGATDAPRQRHIKPLATLLYGMQMGLVLFWLQDTCDDWRQTEEMLAFMRDMVAMSHHMLLLPPAAKMTARLASLLGPFLGNDAETEEE